VATGEIYRAKAADLSAKAKEETNPQLRDTLEQLVQSYLLLADQADRGRPHQVETHPVPRMLLQQQQPPKEDEPKE
jgi:hypothetical protein